MLRARGVQTLLVCGVTTEVCVHTTIREASDRGFICVCVTDCCASYVDEYHAMGLEMISAHDGLFGYVCGSAKLNRSIRRCVASRGKTDMLRSRSFAAQIFQAPSGRL